MPQDQPVDFYEVLKTELSRPEYQGLNAQQAYDKLMELSEKEVVYYKATELDILFALGPEEGEAFLQTVEAVAQNNPVVARAKKWIEPGAPGLNLGDPYVRAMLDQLAPILGEARVAAVKALAEKPISRAQKLGLEWITVNHVQSALLMIGRN